MYSRLLTVDRGRDFGRRKAEAGRYTHRPPTQFGAIRKRIRPHDHRAHHGPGPRTGPHAGPQLLSHGLSARTELSAGSRRTKKPASPFIAPSIAPRHRAPSHHHARAYLPTSAAGEYILEVNVPIKRSLYYPDGIIPFRRMPFCHSTSCFSEKIAHERQCGESRIGGGIKIPDAYAAILSH